MEDKEKQIEKILTDIRKFIGYDTPHTQKKALADYLFEHYQPKIPEDSVVLSMEEFEKKYEPSEKFMSVVRELEDLKQNLEDKVVLSREEYEKSLKQSYEQGKFDIQCDLEKHDKYLLSKRKYNEIMREGQCITEIINKAKEQGGKETAEKFARDIFYHITTPEVWEKLRQLWLSKDGNFKANKHIYDLLVEPIATKFGVEIKE